MVIKQSFCPHRVYILVDRQLTSKYFFKCTILDRVIAIKKIKQDKRLENTGVGWKLF